LLRSNKLPEKLSKYAIAAHFLKQTDFLDGQLMEDSVKLCG